jgi:plasmid stabilization system protein ParE
VSARYDLSPVALDDIDAAAAFISKKSIEAAERFVDEIHDAFDMLARNPHLGHQRSDLTPQPVFFWTAPRATPSSIARPIRCRSFVCWPGNRMCPHC